MSRSRIEIKRRKEVSRYLRDREKEEEKGRVRKKGEKG